MAIISISTVTKEASIFIKRDEKSIFRIVKGDDMLKKLPLTLKEMLDEYDFFKEPIDKLIISGGPGYYTSLRIGESFAKGILIGDDIKKLKKVNSLEVLGAMSIKHKRVIAILKARRDVYHCAVFSVSKDDIMNRETDDMLINEKELERWRGIMGVGEGLKYLKNGWENSDEKIISPDAKSMFKYLIGEKIV